MLSVHSTSETAKILKIDRHNLPVLRQIGLLVGRKQGKGYYYDSEEINDFIRMTRGYDISNIATLKEWAPIILMNWQKKSLAELNS